MQITIELAEEQVASLKAKAREQGLSLDGWLGKLADQSSEASPKPLKSARGILAKYGPGPSAEEIDENRREMFKGFGENF